MLGFLQNRLTQIQSKQSQPAEFGPANKRCYAIGDIHGRFDLLAGLLEKIEADIEQREPVEETFIISLGDLIDRGPDSRSVVEWAHSYNPAHSKFHYIMGNHEEMLVAGLTQTPDLLPQWLTYGGFECAQSYGLERHTLEGLEPGAIQSALIKAIPGPHLSFLKTGMDYIRFGRVILVHAGLRPEIPLEDQTPKDMRWIRDDFLSIPLGLDLFVVHGHTPENDIKIRKNRLGIDSKAYETGILTAARIEQKSIECLTFQLD